MATIQVSDAFLERAKAAAKKAHRSVPKQLEYWEEVANAAENTLSVAQKMERFERTLEKYDKTFEILSK